VGRLDLSWALLLPTLLPSFPVPNSRLLRASSQACPVEKCACSGARITVCYSRERYHLRDMKGTMNRVVRVEVVSQSGSSFRNRCHERDCARAQETLRGRNRKLARTGLNTNPHAAALEWA
jgi:hypothetical protein